MENNKPVSDDDSDIIIIDNPSETIKITENSHKIWKRKKAKKQHKRTVQLGKNLNNDVETLFITPKVHMKKRKFRCIINTDVFCKRSERQCDSIVRFSRNMCNTHTSYERIAPICMRNNCLHVINKIAKSNCCKPKENKPYLKASPRKKYRSYSPISPVAVTEKANISYEDVSDGDFPDLSSEDELDTLIKRTKEREKQFETLKTRLPVYTSSPLHTNEELASTYSSASVHSKTTLVLSPDIEAYSPNGSPTYIQDVKPHPKTTPESIKTEELGSDEYIDKYSPSDPIDTPPRFKLIGDFEDCTRKEDSRPSPPLIKLERDDDKIKGIPDFIKTENGNFLVKAEDICGKREDAVDVNAIFKTEKPY